MQLWKRLRALEWIGSLAGQVWSATIAAGSLGLAFMSSLWEDPLRMFFVVLSSVLLAASLASLWLGHRRRRRNAPTTLTEDTSKDDTEKGMVDVRKIREDHYKRECEQKTKELQERSEELSRQERKYKDLQDEYGKMWVDVCGRDLNPLGLSVAVQFIDYRDSDLAEKIIRLFPPTTWETKEIASISWRRNPCSGCRIVLFSDHEHVSGLKGAINTCALLDGEGVDRALREPHMVDAVTIIIFTKAGVTD